MSLVRPLVALCLLIAVPSFAEEPQSPATFRFEIAGAPVETVLAAFERVTGVTVTVPKQASIKGLPSPGVSGNFTAGRALEKLLEGTGLTARLAGVNAYLIEVQGITESVEVTAGAPSRGDSTMTATRTLTPLRDIPQAITVIPQSMIADQAMQSMADAVRYVPGVGMAQGEGNRDNPILRGSGTSADMFVDGIRDDVQYYRDLYNVESIEALKGPNAMIFGRGGAGGIINRSTRQADWDTRREITVQGGSFDNRRASFDVGSPVQGLMAFRLTGMYESSGSYRRGVRLERYGVNPTAAFIAGQSASIRVGYEHFHDDRTADRGIPSFSSRPVTTSRDAFFGDPDNSVTTVTVDALTAGIDYSLGGGALIRNRTRVTAYDKFYQNVYPSTAVSADGNSATLAAYNHSTPRRNVFSQTDFNTTATSGAIRHTLLAGIELGQQATDNLRKTGFFSATATTLTVRVLDPTVATSVSFRPSATDADNHSVGRVAAAYVQDQAELSQHIQAIAGIRFDRFVVTAHNNRTGADFESRDNLISPRVGVIYKPAQPVSLYSSYSLTYQPRAGELLSSLTVTNQALAPERFVNYEVGAKWDARPDLALTAALYRLDRTNVAVPDPADATRSILVAGQRATGLELSAAGNVTRAWNVVAAYAHQDGRITRTLSASAQDGARLAQLPANTVSIWNKYRLTPRWSAGAGLIHSTDMFTSTDNLVVLPAFTRVDAALFATLSRQLRAQVNVENLLDANYYASANGNNNIAPGSPRAVKVTLITSW